MRENEILTSEMFQTAKSYWLKQLSGNLQEIDLLSDFHHPNTNKTVYYRFQFEESICERIFHISNKNNLSLFAILLTALKILIYKYTGQRDIIIATSTLKSSSQGYNHNILLRIELDPGMSFRDCLLKEGKAATEGFKFQFYPLNKLFRHLNLERGISLFRLMMTLENIQENKLVLPDDLKEEQKNDINFLLNNRDEGVVGRVAYDSGLYKEESIQRLIDHYSFILKQVLHDTQMMIRDIQLSNERDREEVLYKLNHTDFSSPQEQTIVNLFEEQVERVSDGIAVLADGYLKGGKGFQKVHLTYLELNQQANFLASLLREKGISRNHLVGLITGHSIEMILGLVAIIKAGGAYLPIDPDLPIFRQKYMLADSHVSFVLMGSIPDKMEKEILENEFHPNIICQKVLMENQQENRLLNLNSVNQPSDLFYSIYTSGTTGKPKGVLIQHRGFVNMVNYHRTIFKECPGERMSQVASLNFDAMAFEVWPCLLSGASLVIADNRIRIDPGEMHRWLIEQAITITFQTTVMGEQLLKRNWYQLYCGLNMMRVAGEKFSFLPDQTYPFQVYNLYGPTEATIWSTWTEVKHSIPSIGKPIGNTRIYILGPDDDLQPIGVAGELCIAGDGVALGYLNQPELTFEKFWFQNSGGLFSRKPPPLYGSPCHEAPCKSFYYRQKFLEVSEPFFKKVLTCRRLKFYRTGDLGRWLGDGNIEFLGRRDSQLKIRGFRVELGEIEFHLNLHESIEKALVISKNDKSGKPFICAYFTCFKEISHQELRFYLAARLPAYMVPAYFVQLERIPLTVNGKLDINALPDPQVLKGDAYEAPKTGLEKVLAELWQDELGVERVGVTDNFFNIGGDSYRVIQIHEKLKEQMDQEVDIVAIFEYPTIRSFCEYLVRKGQHMSQTKIEENPGHNRLGTIDKAKDRRKKQMSSRRLGSNE